MNSVDVLLVTQDEQTRATVQAVLRSGPVPSTPAVFDGPMAMRTRLSRIAANGTHRVALVDIDTEAERTLFEMSRIIATYSHVRFVALSQEFDEKLVLHAMQAGARHFLRKSAIQAELSDVLNRLLSQEPREQKRLGLVLSVFSCSGGCGATTVAVNIANELRLATGGRVLIVDLDPHYGSAASYLGVKGKYGIGHILNRQGPIDRQLIQSTAISHCDGLDVLLSPVVAEADADTPVHHANLLPAVEVCREAYDHVVLDAPRMPAQMMIELASASQISLLVFQLTIHDVGFAGATAARLVEYGIPRERILLLANRVRRRGALLPLVDGQHIISAGTLHTIRSDWVKAMKGLDQGRPLADVAGRSRLRRDYRRLVARIQQRTANGNH